MKNNIFIITAQQPQVMPMQNQAPPSQMQQFNTPPPFAYGMPPPNYMYYL